MQQSYRLDTSMADATLIQIPEHDRVTTLYKLNY